MLFLHVGVFNPRDNLCKTNTNLHYRNIYKQLLIIKIMAIDKKTLKELIGKLIVTKEGKRLGMVQDVTFETKTGELIHIVVKDPTPYIRSINLEKTEDGEVLIPYNSIIAIGDFVVISEEDLV